MPGLLAVTAALLVAAPSSAVTPTPLNTNLIHNRSFENGSFSNDGLHGVIIPGWDYFNNTTVIKYGTSGFPSVARSTAFGGGKQFYASGAKDFDSCDQIDQSITLVGRNTLIDTHHIKAVVSAWVATKGNQTDTAQVTLYPRDDHNQDTTGMNPIVLQPVSQTYNHFQKVSGSAILHSHGQPIRQLQIALRTDNVQGTYCNAYFDKIVVKIVQV